MDTEHAPQFSGRQARATILAAESLGFEREPDLYPAHYDHGLHEDAQYAAEYLRERDPARLEAALASDEPILAQCAAWRITETGRFSLADADIVLRAATARGFQAPPSDLPLLANAIRWDQARAAVAYFWEQDPEQLEALIGEMARLAPLPDTARITEHGCWGNVDFCRCGR
jgi:hypothetical protein